MKHNKVVFDIFTYALDAEFVDGAVFAREFYKSAVPFSWTIGIVLGVSCVADSLRNIICVIRAGVFSRGRIDGVRGPLGGISSSLLCRGCAEIRDEG